MLGTITYLRIRSFKSDNHTATSVTIGKREIIKCYKTAGDETRSAMSALLDTKSHRTRSIDSIVLSQIQSDLNLCSSALEVFYVGGGDGQFLACLLRRTLRIMAKMRRSLEEGAHNRLVILDAVVMSGAENRLSRYADIQMMMATNGGERTLIEWEELAAASVWIVKRVCQL